MGPQPKATDSAPVLGVALGGGESRRMGRDKARLLLGKQSWIDHTARRLGAVCPRVVVADRGRGHGEGWATVDDGPGRGPAAGILGAAKAYPDHDLLVLACDLPLVPVALLRHLISVADGDWILPALPSGVEPLCALYRRRALQALSRQVEAGYFGLRRLAAAAEHPSDNSTKPLRLRRIEEETLRRWGVPRNLFVNLNAPHDIALFNRLQLPGGDLATGADSH